MREGGGEEKEGGGVVWCDGVVWYRAVMRGFVEAVQHRVAHGAVHALHVDLGPQTEGLELLGTCTEGEEERGRERVSACV